MPQLRRMEFCGNSKANSNANINLIICIESLKWAKSWIYLQQIVKRREKVVFGVLWIWWCDASMSAKLAHIFQPDFFTRKQKKSHIYACYSFYNIIRHLTCFFAILCFAFCDWIHLQCVNVCLVVAGDLSYDFSHCWTKLKVNFIVL